MIVSLQTAALKPDAEWFTAASQMINAAKPRNGICQGPNPQQRRQKHRRTWKYPSKQINISDSLKHLA